MNKVLIIEDEKPAASRLQRLLMECDPTLKIAGHCESIRSSLNWLNKNEPPDLIMLDIHLADGISFEIFKEIDISSHIIFTTAYDEYAIKAFDLNSIGYLLKPIQKDKLQKSLEKFYKAKQDRTQMSSSALLSIIGNLNQNYKKRFLVNAGEKIRPILTSNISYFYSMEKNTFLCSKDDRHYLLEYALDKLEEMVNPEEFFRINRQFLVHISCLNKIVILSKSRIKVGILPAPPMKEDIYVSNARASSFRRWLDDMK